MSGGRAASNRAAGEEAGRVVAGRTRRRKHPTHLERIPPPLPPFDLCPPDVCPAGSARADLAVDLPTADVFRAPYTPPPRAPLGPLAPDLDLGESGAFPLGALAARDRERQCVEPRGARVEGGAGLARVHLCENTGR